MPSVGIADRRSNWIRRSRRIVILAIVLVVAASSLVAYSLVSAARSASNVRASSVTADSDLAALIAANRSTSTWTTQNETVGSWVEVKWPTARTVDDVTLGRARGIESARLTFSDDTALLLTPDRTGGLHVAFPSRVVTSARLTVATSPSASKDVSLGAFQLRNQNRDPSSNELTDLRATASSEADGSTAAALLDGSPDRGDLGRQWSAASSDPTATASVTWNEAQEIATVRLWGPAETPFDPSYSAAAALNGSLRFSDGSRIRVSGVAGGPNAPTTLSFTPRVVRGVSIVLDRTIPQATIGLRAIKVYRSDDMPPIPGGDGTVSVDRPGPTQTCGSSSGAARRPTAGLISLVCPTSGASVSGTARVLVSAVPGTPLSARADVSTDARRYPNGLVQEVANATTGSDGLAVLTFSTRPLLSGPLTISVEALDLTVRPLHVQLYNLSGVRGVPPSHKKGSATLAWDEEFNSSVSMSSTGQRATYGALKPEYWGGSQFGDAVFDSPDSPSGTFSLSGDGALKIQSQPLPPGSSDPSGYGRTQLGGLLSSLRVGASGFAAQYGYYEIRMMSPADYGTWPAFWVMNTDAATKASLLRSTEVDAVELYGNRSKQTCHAVHNYRGKKDSGNVRCLTDAITQDWALGWHTYGVQIGPDTAEFFVDGRLVHTERTLQQTDQPFYFMANLALGGGWPVDLAPVGKRAALWIDYIRVYV